ITRWQGAQQDQSNLPSIQDMRAKAPKLHVLLKRNHERHRTYPPPCCISRHRRFHVCGFAEAASVSAGVGDRVRQGCDIFPAEDSPRAASASVLRCSSLPALLSTALLPLPTVTPRTGEVGGDQLQQLR
ncbi:hypothetical protein BaRGS_00019294, partial [Batillaria attramentaria]